MMDEKKRGRMFWSVKDVAEYLGVSKSLIYARVERKEIPCHKIGARILIPDSFMATLQAS